MRFDRGHAVGKLAQTLFPGGIDVSPANVYQFATSVKKTGEMMQKGWSTIYEAAFQHNDLLVALDILVNKKESWYAYEVKSSYAISETYLHDAAFQYHVITGHGLPLADFSFIYRDKDYEMVEDPDIFKMFKVESVLSVCKDMQEKVAENIEKAKEVVTFKMMPDIAIGDHCNKPYRCDFMGTCWKGVKQEA